MTESIRVFLLDDHEIVRRGLADLLAAEPGIVVVGESGIVTGTAEAIVATETTVAVLDGRLPDGSGIDVCRDVKAAAPAIGCLILSSDEDEDALLAAVLAGADGYLLKEVRASRLVESIRRVAAGESLLDPAVVARVLDGMRDEPSAEPPLARAIPRDRRRSR